MIPQYSLADQSWRKTDEGYELKSIFKMVPAIRKFGPGGRYLIELEDGRQYTGQFIFYIYKKQTFDSPLIRVYIEFKLAEGKIIVPEDSIVNCGEVSG
jgi:hypothetical protein